MTFDIPTLSGRHLTDRELAERWRCCLRTIQRLRRAGRTPPCMRRGRRNLTPLEFVEAHERASFTMEETRHELR